MTGFNMDEFDKVRVAGNGSRNFPLKVESYDLTGKVHFVCGVDLSCPHEEKRVRVFLRDMKSDSAGAKNRPSIANYATNPYEGLTEADLKNPAKMQKINDSIEAKCFTQPGGILMVQSAWDDKATGAISANWLNRVVNSQADLADGSAALFSPAIACLSTPIFPKEGDTGSTYCYCDVLFPEHAAAAESPEALDEALFNALSTSPSSATGKFIAAIRLVDTATGKVSARMVERRAVKENEVQGSNYVNESPANTISRFWEGLPPDFAAGLKEALTNKVVAAVVVPGTRYRLVGKTLEAVETKEATKRAHLPYERFVLADNPAASGFMLATVVLGRFKAEHGQPDGEEDYYVKSVYPLASNAKPVALKALEL